MDIEDAPRKLLFIDRRSGVLDLYDRVASMAKFDKLHRYTISVGMRGHRTPRGVYVINSKVKCPDWLIPDEEWARDAGLIPGTIVPGCTPENPLKDRWLGVTSPREGVGIHGTAAVATLGVPASHGCIRMNPPDVIELFQQVPKGTPVVIV